MGQLSLFGMGKMNKVSLMDYSSLWLTSFSDWISQTRVLVDGGSYVGFLKTDGSFTVNDVPAGSYVVEVLTPNNMFEPVRVDISGRAKGKIRARKVNFLQNSAVVTVPYPLKFKAKEPAPFFEKREQWKVTDMLFNPMVSVRL